MKSSKRFALTFFAAAASFSGSVITQAITITSNISQVVLNGNAGYTDAFFDATSIPTSQLLEVTTGADYSRTQINLSGSGNQVTLLNTFEQKRSGYSGFFANYDDPVYFTVDVDTTYSLSGEYHASDVSTAGRLFFTSSLYDFTTFSYNVSSDQLSENTVNESFVLGGSGGDTSNGFSGSLTGSLIAGHQYRWYSRAFTYAYLGDGGTSASGYTRLDIGGGAPSSVPDGGMTLAMLGMALAGLTALRRKPDAV